MSDDAQLADVYHLQGPEIDLTYRRRKGEILFAEATDPLAAEVTPHPEIGMLVTATTLASDRAGGRYTLTLMLPEVSWEPDTDPEPQEVTGVAIFTRSRRHAVGGPPPVIQDYEKAVRLEGSASPAGPE